MVWYYVRTDKPVPRDYDEIERMVIRLAEDIAAGKVRPPMVCYMCGLYLPEMEDDDIKGIPVCDECMDETHDDE